MTHQDPPPAPSQPPADLARLVKILDGFTDAQHGEDCKAYGQEPDSDVEDKNTEIDDNPSDFLEHCDCGLKDAFEAWRIAKSLVPAAPVPGPAALTWTREKPPILDWYWVRVVHTASGKSRPLGPRRVLAKEWVHSVDGTHYEFAGPIPEPTDSTPSTQAEAQSMADVGFA